MSDPLRLSRAALDGDDDCLTPLTRAIVEGRHTDVRPRRSRDDDAISDLATRIAKLEAAHKRAAKKSTVSKRGFEFAIECIGGFVGKEIRPLLERIEKLEAQSLGVKWAGTWHDGMQCAEGDILTFKGGLWLCVEPSSARPDENATAYRLICKSGSHSGTRRSTAIRN